MTTNLNHLARLSLAWLGVLSFADAANAQYFAANKGDLLAGFRKTGTFAGSYELVINIGNITNLEALPPGTSITIGNFAPSQLSAAFTTYNNLQWSVSAAFAGSTAWAGFPAATLWYTLARSDTNTQSQAQARDSSSNQQKARQQVLGVGSGGNSISVGLGATNANNNSVLVREPVGDPNALTVFIGDPNDATLGDFQGTLYNVENTTPSSFTSLSRSDLYQACPSGTTDPITHLTSGAAYFAGYFTLKADGTMTFTRASVQAAAPPAPALSIIRNGNVSRISFLSTNTATYTLYYTNASGVSAPVAAWPALPGAISGNNSVTNFTDTTAASDRIYRVKAQ